MSLSTAFESPAPQLSADHAGRWSTIAAWLVRRRVRLTLLIFVALVAEDLLIGVRPHHVFDFHDGESDLGLALVAFGVAMRSWAAGVLHKTRELTTTGPYAVIRNPLYVGSFMIMCGFATLIDDVENIFIILGPLAFLYYLQVLEEEKRLVNIYEGRWHDYAASVARFFPRRLPRRGSMFSTMFASWSLRDWVGSREYRAMGATLLGVGAIDVWSYL